MFTMTMCCGGNNLSSRSMLQLGLLLVLILAAGNRAAGLEMGFYRQSCPKAEDIVRAVVWEAASSDPSLAAKLLRVFFHDCFPQGCDASVLLDGPLDGLKVERDAFPNLSLGGLHVIDAAKAALEQACPGTVSCADTLALATRDAVSFQFGRPMWEVETGRRDSRTSRESDGNDVPRLDSKFQQIKEMFATRNLSVADLVALSGAHTLGRIDCRFIAPRLRGSAGGLVDPGYAPELLRQCPTTASRNMVVMDPGSEFRFDSGYFATIKANRAVLASDAVLMRDEEAARLVGEFHDQGKFLAAFAKSITRMGAIRVRTGNDGEVRRNCHVVN